MKGHLYIQNKNGKRRKSILESYYVDINGGENKHDRKLYAMDHDLLIAELFITDMVIGADGILFKGYEQDGKSCYFQEWWLKTA